MILCSLYHSGNYLADRALIIYQKVDNLVVSSNGKVYGPIPMTEEFPDLTVRYKKLNYRINPEEIILNNNEYVFIDNWETVQGKEMRDYYIQEDFQEITDQYSEKEIKKLIFKAFVGQLEK